MRTTLGRMASLLLMFVLMLMVVPGALAAGNAVNMVANPTLGNILTDSDGRTLYRFIRDTVNVSSACYGQCATNWPPLLIADGNPVAGEGVNGNLLGVLTRADGTRQVMYNGIPLYYYNADPNVGDTNGQLRGNNWFVVHPNTTTISNGQGTTVRASRNDALGPFLTDKDGRTLYMFMKDSENHSVCYAGCANTWPPLLVGGGVDPTLDGTGGTLGVAVRNDGNRQVTYGGKPLYYFASDTNPGDTKGQGLGSVWYVVAPVAAAAPAPAAPAAAPAPAALPTTSDGGSAPLGALALVALLLGTLGALIRPRRQRDRV
jgi:predicted lipoprotein with Yx(FWY)xxD motif